MGNNIFFDTCVYHQPGIDLLTKVVPVDNILFASEMVGAVKGTTRGPVSFRRHQALRRQRAGLSAADKDKIFAGNAYRPIRGSRTPSPSKRSARSAHGWEPCAFSPCCDRAIAPSVRRPASGSTQTIV
jgi:hypothetical protein